MRRAARLACYLSAAAAIAVGVLCLTQHLAGPGLLCIAAGAVSLWAYSQP